MVRQGGTTIKNLFEINRRIEIAVSKTQQAEFYLSRIEDLIDDKMVVAMPMVKGFPVHINIGSQVYGKILIDTAVYYFTCQVLGKKAFPLPLWILSEPTQIRKVQQRSFVRVGAMLPVIMQVETEKEGQVFETTVPCISTRNISGGGVAVVTKEKVERGAFLHLDIDIPDVGVLTTKGQVVRVSHPPNDETLFWLGIQFLHLSEKDRAKIIKYVFKKQVEQRKTNR